MSITGTSAIRRLNRVAFVMGLDELGPFGGRAAGGRDGRRLERFAEVGQDLPDRPWKVVTVREWTCDACGSHTLADDAQRDLHSGWKIVSTTIDMGPSGP